MSGDFEHYEGKPHPTTKKAEAAREVSLSPRWTKEEHEKIEFLRNEYYRIGKELKEIVKPTDEEIKDLIEDLNMNRDIYTSYMEEDPFFQSENIYDECNAQLEAEQDDKS